MFECILRKYIKLMKYKLPRKVCVQLIAIVGSTIAECISAFVNCIPGICISFIVLLMVCIWLLVDLKLEVKNEESISIDDLCETRNKKFGDFLNLISFSEKADLEWLQRNCERVMANRTSKNGYLMPFVTAVIIPMTMVIIDAIKDIVFIKQIIITVLIFIGMLFVLYVEVRVLDDNIEQIFNRKYYYAEKLYNDIETRVKLEERNTVNCTEAEC